MHVNTVYENSNSHGLTKISCVKYRNLHNLFHYHSDHEVIYVNEGSAKVCVNEVVFQLDEKESLFVYSNDIHCIIADETSVITVLKAEKEYYEAVFTQKKLSTPVISANTDVYSFLESVYSEIKRGDEYSAVMVNGLTSLFFVTLLRNQPTVERKNETAVRKITHESFSALCGKIADEYSTITFKEAAQFMNYSEKHFSKMFRNLFGMTFTKYLNIIKISGALQMLKQGNMSISEIADSCGFNTIRNFNRVFKAFTGYSPTDIPTDYNYLYSLHIGYGLDPTLNCTVILNE